LAARVHTAIGQLPAGQRQAVVLFYLAGLTHAEIAEEVGSRPGAIKTRLHKARRALRTSLAELHEEHPMTNQAPDLVPMHVADLRRSAADDPGSARHIVFLKETDGNRRLRIWIGASEASALAATLEDVALPRPGVHQFAAALLAAAGTRLREVRVTELTEFTFYAQAVLADGSIVDARPSDALTLALVTGAPIYVSSAVLDQSANQSEVLRDLIEEADSAPHAARAIADEVRARLAATVEELAARGRRAASDVPER
jgi:bifunctional DNase/RNase